MASWKRDCGERTLKIFSNVEKRMDEVSRHIQALIVPYQFFNEHERQTCSCLTKRRKCIDRICTIVAGEYVEEKHMQDRWSVLCEWMQRTRAKM